MQPTSVARMMAKVRMACPAEVSLGHMYVCIDQIEVIKIVPPDPALVRLSIRVFGKQKMAVTFSIELDDICGYGFLELQNIMEKRVKECIGNAVHQKLRD